MDTVNNILFLLDAAVSLFPGPGVKVSAVVLATDEPRLAMVVPVAVALAQATPIPLAAPS